MDLDMDDVGQDFTAFTEFTEAERLALCECLATAATAAFGGLPMNVVYFDDHAAFLVRPAHLVVPQVLH